MSEDIIMNEFPSSFEDSTYLLCNESNDNFTFSSIFCNKSYTFPTYGHTDYKENAELQKIVQIIVPILFGIIFIVGLFGNALVVIVVASNQQMRNTTNLLIINLAIADLLFIIFCVPFTATDYVLSYWPFGVTWCKMVQYLIIVTAYASVLTLVLMSVDRFLAVVYPVESISIRTEKNTYMAITITWIIILLSCVPAFLAHGLEIQTYAYEESEVCMFKKEYNHVIFQIIFMLTSYAIPLAIICLLYFGMLLRLWKSVGGAGVSRNSLRGKKRVTRMVVIVVGVFAICWLPIQLVLVLKSLELYDINDITVAIQITSHVLGYMNSCVNPILYAFLSENFRKAFRKIIQCKCNVWKLEFGIGGGRIINNQRPTINRNNYDEQHQMMDNNHHHHHHGGSSTHINMNIKSETTFLTTQFENGNQFNILENKNEDDGIEHCEESDIL